MEKPTWVKVIGILGIIFGCTGILGSLNIIVMPKIMGFQQEMMEIAMEKAQHDPDFPVEFREIFTNMWNFPEWFGVWAVIFGLAGLLVAAFYLLAGIWMVQIKPAADKLMIWALALSILLALLQVVTIITAASFMAIMFVVGGLFSIVIDVVLLIVILTNDRSIFSRQQSLAGM